MLAQAHSAAHGPSTAHGPFVIAPLLSFRVLPSLPHSVHFNTSISFYCAFNYSASLRRRTYHEITQNQRIILASTLATSDVLLCHRTSLPESKRITTTSLHHSKREPTMASYGSYGAPHYQSVMNNHHGRSRRGPRISSQNAHRAFKAQRSPKEVPEAPTYNDYMRTLEAAKSFEFDDDELFCPFHLLTEDDVRLAPAGKRS